MQGRVLGGPVLLSNLGLQEAPPQLPNWATPRGGYCSNRRLRETELGLFSDETAN